MKQSVLVVFVDALGPTQLEWMAEALSFAPHHRRLRGMLGSSCSGLPTLAVPPGSAAALATALVASVARGRA